MIKARLYKPAQTATQSGNANTKNWVLEIPYSRPRELDPLLGWCGSSDTASQVALHFFESKKDALDYAKTEEMEVTVCKEQKRKPNIRQQGYAENFSYNRRNAWTH